MGNELEKRGQLFFFSGGVQKEVFPIWERVPTSMYGSVSFILLLTNNFYSIAPSGHHYALIQLKIC